MPLTIDGVEWDRGNLAKCRKHGLSTADIEHVLLRGLRTIARDELHSREEGRYIAIGQTAEGRYGFVVFTVRRGGKGGVSMRPISARFMHRKEIERYGFEIAENGKKTSEI